MLKLFYDKTSKYNAQRNNIYEYYIINNMRRVFAGGFIFSSLKIIWTCTALIISLFDPTNDSDI